MFETGKFITSKKQLIGNRPARPIKKVQLFSPHTPSLPPPANLTTQDILDLPIIFADDNQIIDNSFTTKIAQPTEIQPPPDLISNKFMVVNKPNYIIQSPTPRNVTMVSQSKPPPKYTKIILSKKTPAIKPSPETNVSHVTQAQPLIPEVQPKAETTSFEPNEPIEQVDFEKHITPNTVFRSENGTVGTSVQLADETELTSLEKKDNSQKRTAEQAQLAPNENSTPKTVKIDHKSTDT